MSYLKDGVWNKCKKDNIFHTSIINIQKSDLTACKHQTRGKELEDQSNVSLISSYSNCYEPNDVLDTVHDVMNADKPKIKIT